MALPEGLYILADELVTPRLMEEVLPEPFQPFGDVASFRVQGLEFKVSWDRISGLGFRDLGFRVQVFLAFWGKKGATLRLGLLWLSA